MEKRTDKNSYTLLFAAAMTIVVGALLAFTAQVLKSKIDENRRIEKQQNILYAMGVNDDSGENDVVMIPAAKVGDAFNKYIKKQIVIQRDKITENDKAYLIDLKQEQEMAKKPGYQRRLPLFIGEKDGKTYYIVPMRGKGLWDAIWGYIALNKNMVVQGVFFDHKAETPGLGANITQRYFIDDFKGEHLLDKAGNFNGITVLKGNNDPLNKDKTDNEVDALAGATITSNGVTSMLKNELKLYKPYFKNLNKK
jgi:Na+-transporting NADH:ubiquinone oxidoreductase subunit C